MMQRVLDGLPWRHGTKPCLYVVASAGSFTVTLHEPHSRRGRAASAVASVAGPTPEGALRWALSHWVASKKLAPAFAGALRVLVN